MVALSTVYPVRGERFFSNRISCCAEFLQVRNTAVAISREPLIFEAMAIKGRDRMILQVEGCFALI